MTAFAINSGSVVNFDTLAGASSNATLDAYTISAGSTLLIDTDSYQCANRSVAQGSLDNVIFSGLGGTLKIDGKNVRVIGFSGGSGVVPAIGSSISQGGVSSYFLGVWANWQSEPLAAGAAMPSAGFIKLKNKTGGDYSAGALAGISATAAGADVVGWIEVRGADNAAASPARTGKFEVAGDWFYLESTTGVRGQIIPCPTTATVAGVFPAVQIETAVGSGVFEWYVCMGTLAATANTPTDSVRGKLLWQTTAGIRVGSDGTNNVGYLPPAGCRVRIPNVILTCCTRSVSGAGPRVAPNNAMATRYEFNLNSAGQVDIDAAVLNWYCPLNRSYSAIIKNTIIADELLIATNAKSFLISNCVVGFTLSRAATGVTITNQLAGGVFEDCVFAHASSSNTLTVSVLSAKNIDFSNCSVLLLSARASNSYLSFTISQSDNINLNDVLCIGGGARLFGSKNCVITNFKYVDTFFGAAIGLTNGVRGVSIAGGSNACKVSGYQLPISDSAPYYGLVQIQQSFNITVESIGEYSTPLNLESGGQGCAYAVESLGGNLGVKIRRCYVAGTRLAPYTITNSDNNFTVENVAGDYLDSVAAASNNTTIRACSHLISNTGQQSVYGLHCADVFTGATTGELRFFGNEPTLETASQFQVVAGSPSFTSAGNIILPVSGDQIIIEMPYFALGHTALANISPVVSSATNLTIEFQVDVGAGWSGSWLLLSAANLSAVGAIDPAVGFKLKIRVTATASSSLTSFNYAAISTITTAIAQSENLYPLDQITLSLTGLPVGSDITILQAGTETIRSSTEDILGATSSYIYEVPESVDIVVIKPGYMPYAVRSFNLSSTDSTFPIALTPDLSYVE